MKQSNYDYCIFRLKSVHCTYLRRADRISMSISSVHQGWFSRISFSINGSKFNFYKKERQKDPTFLCIFWFSSLHTTAQSNYGYYIFRLKSVHCTYLRRANLSHCTYLRRDYRISVSISFVHQGWFSHKSFSINGSKFNSYKKERQKHPKLLCIYWFSSLHIMKQSNYDYCIFRLKSVHCTYLRCVHCPSFIDVLYGSKDHVNVFKAAYK